MRSQFNTFSMMVVACVVLLGAKVDVLADENWPDFRGSRGDGHVVGKGLPVAWSESKNIVWKTAIHDRGWSSPVIFGERIWLTTATVEGHKLYAVCLDKRTGRVLHDKLLFTVDAPVEAKKTNSYASPSPVIDEKYVFVHYGMYGTACLDAKSGRVIWTRRDLEFDHGNAGPGASPILYGDTIIVQCDGIDQQYVTALDKATGRTIWRTYRSHDFDTLSILRRKAYATPAVVTIRGRDTLLSPGAQAAYAYDPKTGRELWRYEYGNGGFSNISRPVATDDIVYFNTGFGKAEVRAVRTGGSGNVTSTHEVWSQIKGAPNQSSPILIEGRLYMVSDAGVGVCLDAANGAIIWQARLEGAYGASPIFAGGYIYFCSQSGITTIIKPGDTFEVVAKNKLDTQINASPAVVDRAIYIRTQTHVYRIENADPGA